MAKRLYGESSSASIFWGTMATVVQMDQACSISENDVFSMNDIFDASSNDDIQCRVYQHLQQQQLQLVQVK